MCYNYILVDTPNFRLFYNVMDTHTNSHTNQIDPAATQGLFDSIRALDTGISNHEVWISQVHQTLICRNLHPNPADLCEDAHCSCKFGQWLDSPDAKILKDHELFHSVIEKHQLMHALARKILQKNESKQIINEDDYCDFTSHAMSFKLEVRNLQYSLMSQVCVVDHLTGAWNRYALSSKLNQEKERLLRTGNISTICMMDIDHFKRINDNYGHVVGDMVLKTVIGFCRNSLRKYDSIYRYGGEEFIFFLPDTELNEARVVIERLCTSLGKHPIPQGDGESLNVTASFGIVSMQKDISVENSIQSADHALLCAKAQGRNRVCCWEDGLSTFK